MRNPTVTILLAAIALVMVVLIVRLLRKPPVKAKRSSKSTSQRRTSSSRAASSTPTRERSSVVTRPRGELDTLPRMSVHSDDELEITKVSLPTVSIEDEETDTEIAAGQTVLPILFDEEAAKEEPTSLNAFILVTAVGETDIGRRRKRNEDSWILLDDPPLIVVADGMGGYAGGDVASSLCVTTIADAFQGKSLKRVYTSLPKRADEVAQAIEMANRCIYEQAQAREDLKEMGTTVVCARFSPNKQRVYIGHVGDSRCYVFRDGRLHQITTDHTAESLGIKGPMGQTLIRALGVRKTVMVDVILGKPRAGDRYLMCTDGLTKMIDHPAIEAIMQKNVHPQAQVDELVAAANAAGGKDNITAVVVRVDPVSAPPRAAPA